MNNNENDIISDPILRKHVGLIHCENRLTLIQRKICNVLMFNALDKINQQDIFEISIRNLCSFIGYNSNDVALIKRALKSLISIVLEWNLLEKDNSHLKENIAEKSVVWHASALLAGASIEKGVVRYSYSPQIKSILSSLEIYGRINLFVQAKFNSTYGLVLYENCIRFKTIAKTCWFDVDLFRKLMGIDKNKYHSFKELNRNVIAPAVSEINTKADIMIEPEFKKLGNKICSLRFLIKQNEKYFPSFRKKQKTKPNDSAGTILVQEMTQTFKLADTYASDLINTYGENYVAEKINLILESQTYKQNKIANLTAYLISALTKDFQATQLVPMQDTIKVPSAFMTETQNKTTAFQKRYQMYKRDEFLKKFKTLSEEQRGHILDRFSNTLDGSKEILGNLYKLKGLESMLVAQQLIQFVDKFFPQYSPKYLSYEDFITADESEI